MTLFWFHPGGQMGGPYYIQVTRAEHPREARAAFGEPVHSPRVHRLTSPSLKTLLHWLTPGQVHIHKAERLPNSRDYFIENGYR